jgi:threonine/homoserine/homoserine lactone efflux protein
VSSILDSSFFWKGLALGFSIAAPVGPIGLLCIRRSLTLGPKHGFITGLGAASADAFYGGIAGFGLSFLTSVLIAQQHWTRLVGGIFLGYLGVSIFLSKPAKEKDEQSSSTLFRSYISSLALTITNPMTILSFIGAFAGLGLASAAGNYASASTLVAGVFMGSASWWLLLSFGTGYFRKRISAAVMLWINRFSGILICGFAAAALISSAQ